MGVREGDKSASGLSPGAELRRFDLAALLFVLYLGTAPAYWLPNVPLGLVYAAKYVLFFAALSAFLLDPRNRLHHPARNLFGPAGAVLVVSSMSFAIAQSPAERSAVFLVDVANSFVMLWVFHSLVRNGYDVVAILRSAALVIAGLCAVVILSGVVPRINWVSPFLEGRVTLRDAGFGAVRTGWSLGIAFFLPFALMWAAIVWRRSRALGLLIGVAMTLLILGAQLTVSGRVGIVGSLCVLLLWMILNRRSTLLVLPALLVSGWIWAEPMIGHLRLETALQAESLMGLDHASSGRMAQYAAALGMIADNPVFGYGFDHDSALHDLRAAGIHNVWLKLAVQGGLPSLFLLAFSLYAIVFAIRLSRCYAPGEPEGALCRACACVLFAGVAMSMFEPAVIIGAFQMNAVWWASAGIVSGLSVRRRLMARGTQPPPPFVPHRVHAAGAWRRARGA